VVAKLPLPTPSLEQIVTCEKDLHRLLLVTEVLVSAPAFLEITEEAFADWKRELPAEFAAIDLSNVWRIAQAWQRDYDRRWSSIASDPLVWRHASLG
jgi:hypothetical protein